MYPTTEQRIAELERVIYNAQQEIYRLKWARDTDYRSNWGQPQQKICAMPQGHPSHCGCEW